MEATQSEVLQAGSERCRLQRDSNDGERNKEEEEERKELEGITESTLPLLGLGLVLALDHHDPQTLLASVTAAAERDAVHVEVVLGFLLRYGALQCYHDLRPLE
ncbi:hypothetical protein E2C01_035972 [Portunus trituberculatus]|uniref:Uncharacterized protein n=1 Tax=Portunus trituberculatus TaxID=210409 RepID=A0A5B7F7E8_PORTR|nr:hypothetical protein [Portunus trituberculatus]